MIQDLLQKWSDLEPSRCNRNSVAYWIKVKPSGYSLPLQNMTSIDWAMLQSAVFEAIVDRNLRSRLENNGAGWFAVVRAVDQAHLTIQHDVEPAIALLKAYVRWLEEARR